MNHLHGHPPGQDEDFIRMIQSGGYDAEQAVTALYLKYKRRISAYLAMLIRKNPGFTGTAQDLVHDSFIRMIYKIESCQIEVNSVAAFWMGIGKHLLYNQLRKNDRVLLIAEPEEFYPFSIEIQERPLIEEESLDLLECSFQQLGPRCKEILLLWINRYTMHEIAARLGLSGDAMARKIKHECFKKLKNLVQGGNKLHS
jgi:RNA polymerase sigma factor (sigma-70 family)